MIKLSAYTGSSPTQASNSAMILVPICLLLTLTSFGCNSYDEDVTWIESVYIPQISHSYNPKFIFDMPDKSKKYTQISSEQFGRLPWPTSPEANYGVTSPETMTYSERIVSDQRLTADGEPRNTFCRRIFGQRYGQSIR